VYCFGGTDSSGNGTAAGYVYQPATNTWSPRPPQLLGAMGEQ
jgi:hypothetical protein